MDHVGRGRGEFQGRRGQTLRRRRQAARTRRVPRVPGARPGLACVAPSRGGHASQPVGVRREGDGDRDAAAHGGAEPGRERTASGRASDRGRGGAATDVGKRPALPPDGDVDGRGTRPGHGCAHSLRAHRFPAHVFGRRKVRPPPYELAVAHPSVLPHREPAPAGRGRDPPGRRGPRRRVAAGGSERRSGVLVAGRRRGPRPVGPPRAAGRARRPDGAEAAGEDPAERRVLHGVRRNVADRRGGLRLPVRMGKGRGRECVGGPGGVAGRRRRRGPRPENDALAARRLLEPGLLERRDRSRRAGSSRYAGTTSPPPPSSASASAPGSNSKTSPGSKRPFPPAPSGSGGRNRFSAPRTGCSRAR
ncbi:MAG: hypothetical protein FD180_3790 [Planctomycetota bacterium]|nr:MAG: hypothetical protein FD180_3790 [Planctomycetota bacterium]